MSFDKNLILFWFILIFLQKFDIKLTNANFFWMKDQKKKTNLLNPNSPYLSGVGAAHTRSMPILHSFLQFFLYHFLENKSSWTHLSQGFPNLLRCRKTENLSTTSARHCLDSITSTNPSRLTKSHPQTNSRPIYMSMRASLAFCVVWLVRNMN